MFCWNSTKKNIPNRGTKPFTATMNFLSVPPRWLDSVILLFMLTHNKSSVLLKIYIKKDVHHALLRPPGTSLHRPKSLHLVTWHSRCSLIHKARYVLHSRIQIQTAVFSVHENSHDKHNHVCDDMYLLQAEVACGSSGAAEGLAPGKG